MKRLMILVALVGLIMTRAGAETHLTITMDEGGDLNERIVNADFEGLKSLKVVGKMKAADWQYLRSNSGLMAHVKTLDLSEAEPVLDGEAYAFYTYNTGSMGVHYDYEWHLWPRDSVASHQLVDGRLIEYYGNNLGGEFIGTQFEEVTLPKSLDGIGNSMFARCTTIKKVVAGGNERYVGDQAFYEAAALEQFSLPESVDSIAQSAFYKTTSLTSLDISNVRHMGDNAFSESQIEAVYLNAELKSVPYCCFKNSALRTLMGGEGLESVEKESFYGTSLQHVTLGSSLRSIGEKAFAYCRDLETVELPESLEQLASGAFYNTPFFDSLADEGGIVYVNKIAYGITNTLPKDVVIKEGTETLSDNLFARCELNSVQLPQSLKRIGRECFYQDSWSQGLSEIILPPSLQTIGDHAFVGCELTQCDFPESLQSIGAYAFHKVPLYSVTLPEGVKSIGQHAFAENKSLVVVRYNCIAANDDESLDEGYYRSPFYGSSMEKLEIGNNVEVIPDGFLYWSDGTKFKKIDLPQSVKKIGAYAFGFANGSVPWSDDSTELEEISLPDGLEFIGRYAFANTRLSEVTIPENVEHIGDRAFGEINTLKTVNFNARRAEGTIYRYADRWSEWYAYGSPFAYSPVESLSIGDEVRCIMPNFMKDDQTGWAHDKTFESVDLSNVEYIGESAFEHCGLDRVILPERLDTIPARIFNRCEGMTDVVMPAQTRCIGDYAFAGATYLNPALMLNDGLEEICEGAFADCKGMTWETPLTIPTSVRRIGKNAFALNSLWWNLKLFIPETVEEFGEGCFKLNTDKDGNEAVVTCMLPKPPAVGTDWENTLFGPRVGTYTLKVLHGSAKYYKRDEQWSHFGNVIEMDSFKPEATEPYTIDFSRIIDPESEDQWNPIRDTEGTIWDGMLYCLDHPHTEFENENHVYYRALSFHDCSEPETVETLLGKRMETFNIATAFRGMVVMLPAGDGCVAFDLITKDCQLHMMTDNGESAVFSGGERYPMEYSQQVFDYSLDEPAYLCIFLTDDTPDDWSVECLLRDVTIYPDRSQYDAAVGGVVSDSPGVVRRFAPSGISVDDNAKGLLIEHMSDGTTRKVIRR